MRTPGLWVCVMLPATHPHTCPCYQTLALNCLWTGEDMSPCLHRRGGKYMYDHEHVPVQVIVYYIILYMTYMYIAHYWYMYMHIMRVEVECNG